MHVKDGHSSRLDIDEDIREAVMLAMVLIAAKTAAPARWSSAAALWRKECARNAMRSAKAVKVRTLAPLPFARSIAESILILLWSGCAKG